MNRTNTVTPLLSLLPLSWCSLIFFLAPNTIFLKYLLIYTQLNLSPIAYNTVAPTYTFGNIKDLLYTWCSTNSRQKGHAVISIHAQETVPEVSLGCRSPGDSTLATFEWNLLNEIEKSSN